MMQRLVCVLLLVYLFVIIEYSCRDGSLYTQIREFKNSGGSGRKAGIFVSV